MYSSVNRKNIEDVAVSIITRIHEIYDILQIDDVEYIPFIKYAIMGAIDSADENELPEEQQIKLNENLYSYAKGMYIQGCLINSNDDDQGQVAQESSELFDYIYEHEEYPS